MLTQPAVLQVALTKPSGVHASVVVQFDPTLVLPQMLFQAALLNEPGAVTGTLVGAMVHVSAGDVQRSSSNIQYSNTDIKRSSVQPVRSV